MRTFTSIRFWLTTLVLVGLLAVPRLTLAGGVYISQVEVPADIQAGQPVTIGFSIRSLHGDRPLLSDLMPEITATHWETKEQVQVIAQHDKQAGHYLATLTLPKAGEWRWQIHPFGKMDTEYPASLQNPLFVRDAAGSTLLSTDAAKAQTVEVIAGDSFFAADPMEIKAGTTVKWTNRGNLPHNVTAIDGMFASGAMEPAAVYSYTFDTPGEYKYYCEYHSFLPNGAGLGIVEPAKTQGTLSSWGSGANGMLGLIKVVAADEPAAASGAQAAAAPAPQTENAAAQQSDVAASDSAAKLPATGGALAPIGVIAGIALLILALGVALRQRRARTT